MCPDGRIVSGSEDNTVKLWDPDTDQVKTMGDLAGEPRKASRNSDEELLRHVLDDVVLRRSFEVARVLSADPTIDSRTDEKGRVRFRTEVPDGTPNVPDDTYLLILVDDSTTGLGDE